MTFLAPLFLVGLTALAIPVLIHLVQREHRNLVHFPSLMFLQRIPYESVKRRRIRDWLLLAVRLAALALVVAAFARPFLQKPQLAAAAAAGAREVVVLLDASYSMAAGTRWTDARAAATRVVDGMGAGDRASVVLFSSSPEVAVRATGDRERLRSAIELATVTAGTTQYAPAFKLAGSILGESALPRRELVIISDFQRTGWTSERIAVPEGTVLSPVRIGDPTTDNVSVTPVNLERTNFAGQERVTVTAGIINRGTAPIANLPIALEMDGLAIGTQPVSAGPGESASTTFAAVTVARPNTRGVVRIPSDGLNSDNEFHFVTSPAAPVDVRLVGRREASTSNLYLARAFSIGDAPRFRPAPLGIDAVAGSPLKDGLVVVNDVAVGASAADALARFVEGGGGLIVLAGEHAEWPSGNDLLPVQLGERIDRTRGDIARIGFTDFGHPVFELFRTPRSGEFSTARFYGYRALTVRTSAVSDVHVLARFDDGAEALVEGRSGRGRVLVWASALDASLSDFVLKPVFLPFVHRMARYVSGYTEPEPWLTVGQVLGPTALSSGAGQTIVAPSGRRLDVGGEDPDAIALNEAGFYEVRAAGGSATTIATNVDLAESDPAQLDPAAVSSVLTGATASATATIVEEPTDEAREQAQRLWWYLLFGGLVLLALETWMARSVTVKT
ncbi:MAG: BatA domain-containing protein [Vicinamibacterales bacterium]